MSSKNFFSLLSYELERIDSLGLSKRQEKVIEGFIRKNPPKAIIEGKNYYIFNSNDYLSLRFHPRLNKKKKKPVKNTALAQALSVLSAGLLKSIKI
jgi:hypothetical protein